MNDENKSDISVKRKSKDSVFVKFFEDKENILQLYKELHPKITDINVNDIDIQTLGSVIVNNIYNDLGFLVKDKFVMLVEAQSTWNPNIALRMLIYLVETFRRYINNTSQSEHSKHKVKLPIPELYVIYSGEGEKPDTISLSKDFFNSNPNIELKVKVLSKVDNTLSGQYIGFCKVFDEQRKLYNDGIQIAKETYRICIEKGYLIDFMKKNEQEVIDMMSELFDEEYLRNQYDKSVQKKAKHDALVETAKSMILKGKLGFDEISEYSKLPLSEVEEIAKGLKSASM